MVALLKQLAKTPAYMAPNGIMYVQQDHHFYITIANSSKVDALVPKHQNVAEATNAPGEIEYIKNERYSYPQCGNANDSDNSVNSVHCKPLIKHL